MKRRSEVVLLNSGAVEKGVRDLLPERLKGCVAQKVPDTFFLAFLLASLFVGPAVVCGVDANQPAGDRSDLDPQTLPWERTAEEDAPRPAEISGTVALLDLYGIDASQLASLRDGQPLGSDDEETLVKILYRLPVFPRDAEQRWCRDLPEPERLVDAPKTYRAEMFHVRGRATRVDLVQLLPEAAERFEFTTYYRVSLQMEGASHPVVVCARVVPEAWLSDDDLQEPCRFAGLFLKVGQASGDDHAELVFATNRVAWFPDQVDLERGVSADHVYLAGLGMDIGLFDEIRARNRKPLGMRDRDCFYELLAAVGRAEPQEFRGRADRRPNLERLLGSPELEHGRLQTVQGLARRVTRVVISDEVLVSRLGFDHYYQVDIFIPLGDKIVRLGESTADKEAPTFTNTFPVTMCVRRLPSGLAEGSDLRLDVRVPGVFFKLWSYHTEFVAAYDDRQMQVGPMMIGLEPMVVPAGRRSNPYIGLAAGLVAIAALGGIWYGLWRWNRSDRPVSFSVPRQTINPPSDDETDKTQT
jgi:hypothetical protein